MVVGIQDMGAAGLTSSSFEMADRAETGLLIDLSRVPQRAKSMTAYELLLSESQERMLMVIKPEKWQELANVLEKWQLHYSVIGKVTDTGRMQASFDGKLELDVPIAPLAASAPKYSRPIEARSYPSIDPEFDFRVATKINEIGVQEFLQKTLERDGSKEDIYRQYDQHIGATTHFSSSDGGAAVQWLQTEFQDKHEPYLGLLSVVSCNERYCRKNPKTGASLAVLKAARMIGAAGGVPLAITDCLNYGNPEDPHVMWDFSEGVDGISAACLELSTPVVSGNVSLYNETDGESIAPTPMIGMVGKITDVRKSVSPSFTKACKAYLLALKSDKGYFGASLAAQMLGFNHYDGELPPLDYKAEKEALSLLQGCADVGLLQAARDVGAGGLLTTLYKMAVKNSLNIRLHQNVDFDVQFLFGERSSAYILGITEDCLEGVINLVSKFSDFHLIELADLDNSNHDANVESAYVQFKNSLKF
ncbi:MAG: AIR synthase-related protein [Bdellovibrionota bacterium]